MNSITQKLQKCCTHKIAIKIVSKMLKQPNLFHSQPATRPKDAPVKFYIFTAFGSSFMITSVAPTRSSTFYAYLITKTGNCNLNKDIPDADGMKSYSIFLKLKKKTCMENR